MCSVQFTIHNSKSQWIWLSFHFRFDTPLKSTHWSFCAMFLRVYTCWYTCLEDARHLLIERWVEQMKLDAVGQFLVITNINRAHSHRHRHSDSHSNLRSLKQIEFPQINTLTKYEQQMIDAAALVMLIDQFMNERHCRHCQKNSFAISTLDTERWRYVTRHQAHGEK